VDCFSQDYATARARFRTGAAAARAAAFELPLSATGPHGEALAIEVAWCGAAAPRRVLLHSSGLHGVEGFAGSAIQVELLASMSEIPPAVAVAFVHVLNPYGMAWLRRVNERNVDLNRNFLGPGESYAGHPDGYAGLDSFLNPAAMGFLDLFPVRAAWLIWKHGLAAVKRSVASGQYDYPNGLFFGGHEVEEVPRIYSQFLTTRLANVEQVIAIDVHTGLGPFGEDTLLVPERDLSRMRQWFGERVQPVASSDANVAYAVRGGLHDGLARVLDRARLTFVGQEFGTYSPIRVLGALRRENWGHRQADRPFPGPENLVLREVFCPADASWRRNVLKRGRDLYEKALGLLLEDAG